MKSLILFLFLGATVALAEIHVENDPNGNDRLENLRECVTKCFGGKVADEENHPPHHHHRRFLFPHLTNCIRECSKKYPLLPRPTPTEPSKVLADVKNDPQDPHPSFGPERKKCIRECINVYHPTNIPSVIPEVHAAEEMPPSDLPNPTTHRPTFSPELEKCIEKCMAMEEEER